MFYEDVTVARGETLTTIGTAYGYKAADVANIWSDKKNGALVAKRKDAAHIAEGDVLFIPIPWEVQTANLIATADGAEFESERDGELGKQLTWVQTVYQSNQPIGATTVNCVDACPADDDLPFYYTDAELIADANRRKRFYDAPSRGNRPTKKMGTTHWRGILSLAVVTKKRVTIWDSQVWGFDMPPAGIISVVGPRNATVREINGHLQLLQKGVGTGPVDFSGAGWTFRRAERAR